MLDTRVQLIAENALSGTPPTRSDLMYLLKFDAYSPEAAHVCAIAREIGMRACNKQGYIYAQIGVDQTACPENCRFCAFAAMNTDPRTYDPALVEVPLGRIVHFAKVFDDTGVNLISLMATAGLDFDRYLDIVRAVRTSISPEARIMANVGDITLDQAQALKEAGANCAYHALRLGEGELTDIKPVERKRTMRHLRAAGLPLMTGIEPVWRNADALEISERIMDLPDLTPFCIGACNLTSVEGADYVGHRPALTGFVRYVAALARLECGEAVPVGGIGGVAWVDAGCDPRNRNYGEDDATLRSKVAAARNRLQADGFTMAKQSKPARL